MPHRASPAAGQTGCRHIAAFKDAQCRDQLLFKERPATSVIGQRRCGRHDRHIPASLAVKAFQPPHGSDDFGGYAIARFDLAQNALVTRKRGASFSDPFIRCCNSEVIFKRAAEFRLVAVPFDHPRQIARTGKATAQGAVGNALRRSTRFERRHPRIIACIRLRL